ncbi:MAG: hypothetical protein JRG96_09540 [Deltaproteobacteria bacterium]|nr:hypothetical protein [Deltaproteobacteria bacterium]
MRLLIRAPMGLPVACLLAAEFLLGHPEPAAASATADVTYTCLDFSDAFARRDYPAASLDSSVNRPFASGSVELTASGDAQVPARGGVKLPTHGAAGGVSTAGVSVPSFDFCTASGGSLVSVIVEGKDTSDPGASGNTDVYFAIELDVTLEFRNDNQLGAFNAFAGLDLATPFGFDVLDLSAGDGSLDVPPELTVENLSSGGVSRYRISGVTSVATQLRYGPYSRNLVNSMFYAGGEFETDEVGGDVAGFAAASALDTLRYRIISRNPDVSFRFVSVPEPAGGALALAALAALASLAGRRRSV